MTASQIPFSMLYLTTYVIQIKETFTNVTKFKLLRLFLFLS